VTANGTGKAQKGKDANNLGISYFECAAAFTYNVATATIPTGCASINAAAALSRLQKHSSLAKLRQ
jgi:hypothetical protein